MIHPAPKHKYLIPLFCLVLLGLAACSGKKTPETAGKAYFVGYGCYTCHKIGNEGGVLGPDLTYIGFRKSPEWLDQWMHNPTQWKKNTLMPNFYLKDAVRKDIVAYLSSLKGQGYRDGQEPWNEPGVKDDPVKRGALIYERAGCVGCHSKDGKGGNPNNNVVGGLIPSLTMVADGYSKEELKEKISKGVAQSAKEDPNGPDPMIHMPAWGETLKEDELDALVEYLYSLRPPRSAEDSW